MPRPLVLSPIRAGERWWVIGSRGEARVFKVAELLDDGQGAIVGFRPAPEYWL